jgi:hypothetical protein
MGFPNPLTQGILGPRNDNQVGVVRHQTICPNLDGIFMAPLGHQPNIFTIVIFAEKILLPPVTLLSKMVRNSRSNDSSKAPHGPTAFSPVRPLKNYVWCPPNSPTKILSIPRRSCNRN